MNEIKEKITNTKNATMITPKRTATTKLSQYQKPRVPTAKRPTGIHSGKVNGSVL